MRQPKWWLYQVRTDISKNPPQFSFGTYIFAVSGWIKTDQMRKKKQNKTKQNKKKPTSMPPSHKQLKNSKHTTLWNNLITFSVPLPKLDKSSLQFMITALASVDICCIFVLLQFGSVYVNMSTFYLETKYKSTLNNPSWPDKAHLWHLHKGMCFSAYQKHNLIYSNLNSAPRDPSDIFPTAFPAFILVSALFIR